jgi:hypothetical protein
MSSRKKIKKNRWSAKVVAVSGLILGFGLLAGSALAMFMAQGKVKGITISTTTPSLTINDQTEWDAGLNFENIAPGWSSESPLIVFVDNQTPNDAPMELSIKADLKDSSLELADAMQMTLLTGIPGKPPFEGSLSWWAENETLLLDNPLTDYAQEFYITFSLPEDVDNELQGTNLDLDLEFTGTLVSN